MSKTGYGFTEGPWAVGTRNPDRVFTRDGQIIADCDREHKGWPIFETNARAIAALPELVEAAAEMAERARKKLYPQPDKPNSDWAALERLDAALSKLREGAGQ